MELLPVVVGSRLVDLCLDLLDAAFDLLWIAKAFHDRGVVLVDRDALGAAEVSELHIFQLDADIFRDHLAAGEDRDILQHGLAAIAESRGLDGRHVERATELVDHQSRQGFAFHVFSKDHERLAHLGDLLEDW